MIHWFTRRWHRSALLLGVPVLTLAFVFLNTAGSTQSTEQEEACQISARDSDSDCISDEYELFFGLSPTNSDDAVIDYDGDALSNIEESKLLTDPFCWDTDRDGFSDLIDSNAVSRTYICWGDPQFTTGDQYEYAHPDWLLGAYKNGGEWVVTSQVWYVSAYESNGVAISSGWRVLARESNLPAVSTPQALQAGGVGSLNIDLDRTILTNNLRYAIHYSAGSNSSLYLDLLDTNGVIVAGDLFGNLLSGSNIEDSIILNIPTASFPSAAVIQLWCGEPEIPALNGAEVIVYEGLLYIDEDGDGLDADQEKQLGTSDYSVDSNGNGTNDYDECFNTGSLTNNPGGGDDDGKDDDKDKGKDKQKGVIYVDQALGNDAFSGRSPAISANKGPKKTVHGGLSVVETNDTIIIRSGVYNENMDIRGKDVKMFIEGNVRL